MTGVYNIPFTRPFLDTLAVGLLQRTVDEPLALARVTVLLPTRRACLSLREAFLRLQDKPSLLPRMQALGHIDADELALTAGAIIPPAITPLRRLVRLAQILMKAGYADSPGKAIAAARLLGGFLDELQTNEIEFDAIRTVVPDRYADHWKQVLKFLDQAAIAWPALMAAEGALDPAERRRQVLDAQGVAWRSSPPQEPVILAGSNGASPALRRLMEVVAGLPAGEVILHGLDRELDATSWQSLEPSHPQHGLREILDHLNQQRDCVDDWQSTEKSNSSRELLIREIMRPSETVDRWQMLSTADFQIGLQGLSRIDCANQRDESEIIAAAMRASLAVPGKRAALVTPDRELARMVRASLARWGLEVDDSAGTQLSASPPGAFMRLCLRMVVEEFAPIPLLACLKHPLAQDQEGVGAYRRQVRLLEMAALRGPAPAPGLQGLRDAMLATGTGIDIDVAALAAWLDDLETMVAPLVAAMEKPGRPTAMLQAHIMAAEALAGDNLWKQESGGELASFLSEAIQAFEVFEAVESKAYPVLFDVILSGNVVRPNFGTHPRLSILGTLEARLQQPDLMILSGLNEGGWPETIPADPFLSRPLRAELGLPVPEEKLGASAHDFASGLGAAIVLLTRSERVGGAPSVPCRWLLRLDAVLRAAGIASLPALPSGAWIAGADECREFTPAIRPAPAPPVSARPRKISVTDYSQLLADPYVFYARRILSLPELDALAASPSSADKGNLIHRVLERFVKEGNHEPDFERLLATGRAEFSARKLPQAVTAIWWPRFLRIAAWIVQTEIERQAAGIEPVALEAKAQHAFEASGGTITLRAKADRIDIHPDGMAEIIDYKTGAVPSMKDVENGDAPQLPLEAELLRIGAFDKLARHEVREVSYWALKGGRVAGEISGTVKFPVDALDELEALMRGYDDPNVSYRAVNNANARYVSPYSHLARHKEWAGDGEE